MIGTLHSDTSLPTAKHVSLTLLLKVFAVLIQDARTGRTNGLQLSLHTNRLQLPLRTNRLQLQLQTNGQLPFHTKRLQLPLHTKRLQLPLHTNGLQLPLHTNGLQLPLHTNNKRRGADDTAVYRNVLIYSSNTQTHN